MKKSRRRSPEAAVFMVDCPILTNDAERYPFVALQKNENGTAWGRQF